MTHTNNKDITKQFVQYVNMGNLQPGNQIEIFQLPLTRKDSEGWARVMERRSVKRDYITGGTWVERWRVQFLSDPGEDYERDILCGHHLNRPHVWTYSGVRYDGRKEPPVFRIERERYEPVSLAHVVRHSPTGMEFGYGGSGPADIALSVLSDYKVRANLPYFMPDNCYHDFKWAHVNLAETRFIISSEQIADWLKERNEGGCEE